MLSEIEEQEVIENQKDVVSKEKWFVGNIRSDIFHHEDCYHVRRMNPKNKIITDNCDAGFRPCAHCQPDRQMQRTLDYLFKLHKHAIPCEDERIIGVFGESGCRMDGNKEGSVLMYPVELLRPVEVGDSCLDSSNEL